MFISHISVVFYAAGGIASALLLRKLLALRVAAPRLLARRARNLR